MGRSSHARSPRGEMAPKFASGSTLGLQTRLPTAALHFQLAGPQMLPARRLFPWEAFQAVELGCPDSTLAGLLASCVTLGGCLNHSVP